MRAIVTRYRGPTDTGGARILVYDEGKCKMRVPYDHGASSAHEVAVRAYCKRMGWTGELVNGDVHGDTVWVWVEGDRITV